MNKAETWFGAHQTIGLIGLGAVGGYVGHLTMKSTTGIVVGAILGAGIGYWLGHQMAASSTPSTSSTTTVMTPASNQTAASNV